MSPIPPRAIRGQTLTADLWNALVDALLQIRPLAGVGVRLRQTPAGTIIDAAPQTDAQTVAAAAPFRHRWQTTAAYRDDGDGARWVLAVAPGSLWQTDAAGALAEAALTPVEPVATNPDGGGWVVDPAEKTGSLYVAENAGETPDTGQSAGLLLKYGDPAAETLPVLLRVADLDLPADGSPAKLTQRQVGDALRGAAQTPQPGPLTREEDASGARWVRRLGSWAWRPADAQWAFTPDADADGAKRPPIESFPERTVLLRVGDDIAALPAPLPAAQAPALWLAKREADVTVGLTYTPPADETGSGALTGRKGSFRFWSDRDPAAGETETYLETFVEDANDRNTYQDAQ